MQVNKIGFEKGLYDRIHVFNRHRIDAIHGYVIGTIDYQTISKAAFGSDELLRYIVEYVIRNTGKPATHRNHLFANPGSMTIHVESFCNEVLNGRWY